MILQSIQSNQRKSAVLIVLLAGLLMGVGYALGTLFDPQAGGIIGVLGALGLWLVLILVNLAAGESILLGSVGAREVKHEDAPRLFNIVEEMKIASGLPAMPRVYLLDSPVPNAFAVGLKPERAAVAVTTGLMARLNRDELQGVVAHEMAHVANRDTLFMTLAGVTMGVVIILADLYLRGNLYGGRMRRSSSSRGEGQAAAVLAIIAILLAILAPLLAQMLYFACSRRREYLADACGARFTRYPEGLASALEKIAVHQGPALQVNRAVAPMFIVNPLAAAGSASGLFSTHPPLTDRIRILRGMTRGASLAAYEEAYRSLHHGASLIGTADAAADTEPGVRAPSGEPPPLPGAQRRAVQDMVHQVNGFGVIACPCGVRLKIPPSFHAAEVTCPRCGRAHPARAAIPLAVAAAAAAAEATRAEGRS